MKLMPSCHEVQAELTDYAEGSLPVTRRVGIWLHLLLCHVCAGFLRGMKALPGLAKQALGPPKDAPEGAAKALSAVMAELLKHP